MASDRQFVDYVCDQASAAGRIECRRMFGEYALYCEGKVVGLVCDNRLFVRPTAAGRAMIARPVEAAPYPGAKPQFLIEEQLEDGQWLSALLRITEKEVPLPKPKARRSAADKRAAKKTTGTGR
jgi:TfoX/Sxy family transcriptional regulator of competence genes